MNAGDLIEQVAFDQPVNLPDGSGGTETSWSADEDAYRCRAHFRYLRGGEAVMAARLEGRQPVVATIRNSAAARAIGSEWRMRDARRGTIYNIRSIVPSDDRRFIEITAESGVAV